jgi:hypothetical protein
MMNRKIKLYTMGLFLLLIGSQYWVTLNEQKAPPSPEWSRSFPTDDQASDYVKLQSVPTENGHAISLLNFRQLDLYDCTLNMDCKKTWSNTELNAKKNTWSDGKTSYYLVEDSLIRSTVSGEKEKIADEVEDFTKSQDTLVYWTTDEKVFIEQGNTVPVSYVIEKPIYTANVVGESIFILTRDVLTNRFTVYQVDDDMHEFFQFTTNSSEIIQSLTIYSKPDQQFGMLLDIEINSGGSRQKSIRTTTFNLADQETPTFSELNFVDQKTGVGLSDVRFPNLYVGNNDTYISFTASHYDSTGKKVNQAYVGAADDELIEASASTKVGDLYTNPILLNDDTLAYFQSNGTVQKLMYSSTTEEKREQSLNGLEGDNKEALYTMLTLLFNGFVMMLLSFTWLVPALSIGYGSLALLHKYRSSNAYFIALLVNTVALVVSQLVLFSTVFNTEKIVMKAPYITEVWQLNAILIFAGILCLVPIFLSRSKVTEDNGNALILYSTTVNFMILFFLIGPYFL